jgi:hypothetical protein
MPIMQARAVRLTPSSCAARCRARPCEAPRVDRRAREGVSLAASRMRWTESKNSASRRACA